MTPQRLGCYGILANCASCSHLVLYKGVPHQLGNRTAASKGAWANASSTTICLCGLKHILGTLHFRRNHYVLLGTKSSNRILQTCKRRGARDGIALMEKLSTC